MPTTPPDNPTSDPTDILLAHNRWATRNLLQACAALTVDQFHQRFDMGPGSLHDTLSHVLGAMLRWTDMLRSRTIGPPLENEKRTPEQLLTMLDEIATDLDAAVRAHPLDEIVTGERHGQTWSFTRGAILTHVTTHSMHHRAQCLNHLRHLGVDPIPPSAVVEWMVMEDGQGQIA